MSEFALAAVLGGTILLASTISVEIALSVALVELAGGVFIGNVFQPEIPDWLTFIGSFAGMCRSTSCLLRSSASCSSRMVTHPAGQGFASA